MKKILFLIHDLSYGGAERVLVNLVNGLDKNKYDVYVQTLFDVGVNRQYLNKDIHYIPGLKKMFKGNASIMKLFSPKMLCKLLIKGEYDLAVSFLEGPCARILSAYNGKKVTWIHVEHLSEKGIAGSFRSYSEMRKCYDSFDSIACVAETVKENFLRLSKTKTKCEVIYNVNNTDEIIAKSLEKQEIITKCDGCFNIISVGRLLNYHKGYDRLIKVHKMLIDAGIKNKVYIIGEGEDKNNLLNLISNLGVENTCFLLGFHQNPYKYLNAADLFVCSSNKEGFSTAVTEALVLGLPIVSTNVSGAYELLGRNNEYGIVVDNSLEGVFKGVSDMLLTEGLLEKYKKLSYQRGKSFISDVTIKANEEFFDNLIMR